MQKIFDMLLFNWLVISIGFFRRQIVVVLLLN